MRLDEQCLFELCLHIFEAFVTIGSSINPLFDGGVYGAHNFNSILIIVFTGVYLDYRIIVIVSLVTLANVINYL